MQIAVKILIVQIQLAVHTVVKDFPITDERLIDLQEATKIDSTLQRLKNFIEHGWPTNIVNVPQAFHDFWKIQDSLCIAGDLILFGNRLVVPKDRQQHILKCIHEGHLGFEKCKARARTCVYWPNMNNSIEQEKKSKFVQFVIRTVGLIKRNHFCHTQYRQGHGTKWVQIILHSLQQIIS